MEKDSLIYVAGHEDFVGSAIVRRLKEVGYNNLLLPGSFSLTDQRETMEFFKKESPEYVFLVAEKVGGILANKTYPADFIYQNLIIQTNVIHSAYLSGVKKLLFPGSSCSYPKMCPQPMKEEYLLSGHLESTNEAYAVAKIAGIKMCQAYNKQYGTNYLSVIPANLYGTNDDFDPESSHVLPALIRRFHEAKMTKVKNIAIWGSGKPRREFLYVDDFADASIFLMNNYNNSQTINIGTGEDISIGKLATIVKEIVGFEGKIVYDQTKPDGMPRKLLDVSHINALGWRARTSLEEGIKITYNWYKELGLNQ